MAPRRNTPKGAGSSPSQGARKETKHGGNKNGKKEGLSRSSFFTWFMVIALLGVWTSVAVVWFELVDYEEVLAKAKDFRYNLSEVLQGKLGIYDADGDGDFDVEDAKVLLVKEAIKEPLKKIREREAFRKKENEVEEREKTMEGKVADRKVKKAVEVAKLRKDSDKVKKDKGKENEKSGIDKNVKHKETMKKSAPEKKVTPSQAEKDTVTKKIAKIPFGVSENSAKEDERKKRNKNLMDLKKDLSQHSQHQQNLKSPFNLQSSHSLNQSTRMLKQNWKRKSRPFFMKHSIHKPERGMRKVQMKD
ncbi:aspartyl/asparaginyl beta-hydroxylase isoform X23 [Gopherus flavomarginatus]|uniref:aspartyl/asparaginyl beta-hydroxylase isoform X23 n=1 Tax=Gopherus flavomarginatus TaxID=286002 RepID=UPI0021CBA676|nr:aspartyl/asparaginyl beta-hydroxylase isoform X23 [Gopherus flavomarginatus]